MSPRPGAAQRAHRPVPPAAAAAARAPGVAEAARAALAAGGGAIDAVIAGFFAAAGSDPGVLLAPAVALVAGAGVGARAFDGRSVQPGRGAPRPRGYVDEASIPAAARAGAPRSVAMISLLHGYRGRLGLHELARAGVAAATARGAGARARLLERVGQAGLLALRVPEILRPLIAAGGAVAGGALTEVDVAEARPAETGARTEAAGSEGLAITPPWGPGDGSRAIADAIVAIDGWGLSAALAFAPPREGVLVPELEIELGTEATPVRRGTTRATPGEAIPAPAPIAIVTRAGGLAVALGISGETAIAPDVLGAIGGALLLEPALSALLQRFPGAALAVYGDGKSARVIGD